MASTERDGNQRGFGALLGQGPRPGIKDIPDVHANPVMVTGAPPSEGKEAEEGPSVPKTLGKLRLVLEVEGTPAKVRVAAHQTDPAKLVLKGASSEAGAALCKLMGIRPGSTWKGAHFFFTEVDAETFQNALRGFVAKVTSAARAKTTLSEALKHPPALHQSGSWRVIRDDFGEVVIEKFEVATGLGEDSYAAWGHAFNACDYESGSPAPYWATEMPTDGWELVTEPRPGHEDWFHE